MSASGQASSLKQQHRKDYELWQKSAQIKKEMTHMRTELYTVNRPEIRKGVTKRGDVIRSRSINPAQKKIAIRAQKLERSFVRSDFKDTFYNSPTQTRREELSYNKEA